MMAQPTNPTDAQTHPWSTALWWLVGLYVAPLLAMTLDELVFRTLWFVNYAPDWLYRGFHTLYPFFPHLEIVLPRT